MAHHNTDVHTRVWPRLCTAAGTTLELAPGEEADVFERDDTGALVPIPADFADPYLEPVAPRRKKDAAPGATTATEADAAAPEVKE